MSPANPSLSHVEQEVQAPTAGNPPRGSAPWPRALRLVDIMSRVILALIGCWVLWRTRSAGWTAGWLWIVGVYAALSVGTTAIWATRPAHWCGGQWAVRFAYAGYAVDAAFATALIWRDGGLASSLYILLALLALKGVALSPALPATVWMPFGFGPLYAAALWLDNASLGFVADQRFLDRYLLLWIWLLGAVCVAWALERRAREASELGAELSRQQLELAQKTEILQRTATDLGDRLLELRSLQEVSRALAATLRLEETLQLIVERLVDVTGSSRCAVALNGPEAPSRSWASASIHGALTGENTGDAMLFELALSPEHAALELFHTDHLLRVPRSEVSMTPLGELLGAMDYIVAPLVSRGRTIGALYLAEDGSNRFDTKTEQLVTSFAYFAATSVENSRLYQEAWEKRQELEAVLTGIGDGVVVADPDMQLILMNPVAQEMLGLSAEPPAGTPLGPLVAAPAFVSLMAETLQGQQELIRELEVAAPGRESTSRTYGALASPVLDADGAVRGVVAVLRDITAQKELERMKSNFLSVVSHELRTPLHSIKGFVEIILMGKTGPVTELQEDFLQTVKSQTGVLQRMIDDLLEFSRMEAGRVKLHVAEVSLQAVAHSVATKLAPLAEEGHLELRLDLPDTLPEVDGDRVRLEQVLTNLVGNAIKFTPAGGYVHVRGEDLGDRVRLVVEDSGIGIPPEEQERVFDRFYQVDGSERRAYRGTGLGLSICKHIVERHNGRIWVESDGISGHGSCFIVELHVELHMAEAPTIDFTTPSRR